VQGDCNSIKHFSPSDQYKTSGLSGATVAIENVHQGIPSLLQGIYQKLAKMFCVYLSKYPNKKLFLDGDEITPNLVQESYKEYNLGDVVLGTGKSVTLRIVIIQWKFKLPNKTIYFCDEAGVALDELPLVNKMIAVKPDFSIYIMSDFFPKLK